MDDKAEHGIVQDNGRNSNIVSAYSYNTGITLATEACREKGNEIKAIPQLIDKISISGKIVTADAMSMQKDIIDKIRKKGGDFQIELKANQRSLRYGVEDSDKEKWGGNMTIIKYEADTIKKSSGAHTLEKRLYVSSLLQVLRRRVHWCASTGQ